MSVRARIISLKLIEKAKDNPEYMKQIGVETTMKRITKAEREDISKKSAKGRL